MISARPAPDGLDAISAAGAAGACVVLQAKGRAGAVGVPLAIERLVAAVVRALLLVKGVAPLPASIALKARVEGVAVLVITAVVMTLARRNLGGLHLQLGGGEGRGRRGGSHNSGCGSTCRRGGGERAATIAAGPLPDTVVLGGAVVAVAALELVVAVAAIRAVAVVLALNLLVATVLRAGTLVKGVQPLRKQDQQGVKVRDPKACEAGYPSLASARAPVVSRKHACTQVTRPAYLPAPVATKALVKGVAVLRLCARIMACARHSGPRGGGGLGGCKSHAESVRGDRCRFSWSPFEIGSLGRVGRAHTTGHGDARSLPLLLTRACGRRGRGGGRGGGRHLLGGEQGTPLGTGPLVDAVVALLALLALHAGAVGGTVLVRTAVRVPLAGEGAVAAVVGAISSVKRIAPLCIGTGVREGQR